MRISGCICLIADLITNEEYNEVNDELFMIQRQLQEVQMLSDRRWELYRSEINGSAQLKAVEASS